ncbi:DNA helicase RecQ [Rhizobium sp. RM]|uniref:DNA helicase RecQ n=1 Tax=Rhizobium sp. RM TaxID=2748079 RepID=UPI00110D5839|nr:DNA helicase RecQ [Rhizobium sp. RM]NWJ27366.1 DNA helicase RecQ [Rhizobium sp. RM]TMV20420.1 DNA helicase RecQ [Rhizobium sp. Td3]
MPASIYQSATQALFDRNAIEKPLDALRRIWGYQDFRGKQEDVIAHIMSGNDAMVLFPTGKGKSLCFQLPAVCLPGVTVVISPLIALMKDQVEELKALGVEADCLWSQQSEEEAREVRAKLRAGKLKLIYVTPERVVLPGFADLFGNVAISLIAIDECHCVSSWGHNFRKDYLGLGRLKELYPGVPRIALTATADPHTRDDIIRQLDLDDATIFVDSFDRPNISYHIAERDNARTQLLRFLQRHEGSSGIVYCLSRRKVEETASWLNDHGIKARAYHAGMDPQVKADNQDAFRMEEDLCLVATVAFGMGINKPNVRYVAHLELPSSVEGYYQETGRAGRDGLPSEAFMIYGMHDIVQRQRMIDEGEATDDIKRIERAKLSSLLGICETAGCRRKAILSHFGEAAPARCGNCDTCNSPVETWDGSEASIKALAAVYRTGERFGTGHVIDVLLGKVTERTTKFGHDKLAVFGVGKELTVHAWQSVFRQLLALGYIRVAHDEFGALKLEPSAHAVFKKEVAVILRRDTIDAVRKRERGKPAASAARTGMSENDESLFQALRAERMAISKSLGVAPYVVFPDTTLIAFATTRPRSEREMLAISGVGATKYERYGEQFMAVIDEHEADR